MKEGKWHDEEFEGHNIFDLSHYGLQYIGLRLATWRLLLPTNRTAPYTAAFIVPSCRSTIHNFLQTLHYITLLYYINFRSLPLDWWIIIYNVPCALRTLPMILIYIYKNFFHYIGLYTFKVYNFNINYQIYLNNLI